MTSLLLREAAALIEAAETVIEHHFEVKGHRETCSCWGNLGAAVKRLAAVSAPATPAEQEREAGRLEALALHERYLNGDMGPAEYERLRGDLGKQPDDLTRVDV